MTPVYLFLMFLKYSLLCFGGGYMLIPLLSADLVGPAPRPLTEEMFARIISIAQVTPGPVFINTATFVGFMQAKFLGAALATLGAFVFSVPLVVLAVKLLHRYEKGVVVQGFLRGMKPASFGMILAAAWIFGELSVLSEKVRWFSPECWNTLSVNWGAAAICAAALGVFYFTKAKLTYVLIAAAIAGAFLC